MSLRLFVRDETARSIAVASETHTLVLRHTSPSVNVDAGNNHGNASKKARCMVEFSADVDLSEYRRFRSCTFTGILGLINIEENLYLCLIRDAVRVATIRPGEHVHRILAVDFFCVNRSHYDSESFPDPAENNEFALGNGQESFSHLDEGPDEHPCSELKRMLSTGTFYYSNDFDLTNRMQDRISEQSAFDIDGLDDEFLWSQYLIRPLLDFRSRLAQPIRQAFDATRILTLAIRGYVTTITVPPSSIQQRSRTKLPSSLTLISRLSCRRAGTRFNSRGIDDDGNVANFVETESIIWHPAFCFSYVQIRGSVPLFWEQATMLLPGQQKIQVTRSPEATQPAFDKHFERLEAAYGVVSILNLLSEARSGEAELTARFQYHVRQSSLNQDQATVAYPDKRLLNAQLDFHAEVKAGGSAATHSVKRVVQESAASFAYFASELEPDRDETYSAVDLAIRTQQVGVFRTNCLDCLDRTNLVQTILSQIAIEKFFRENRKEATPDFWTRHSTLWADNGDALSKIYAGTGALKSSFTRHGKMSLAGALADARKSATRLYVNNFVDKGKQNTIDMLLGRLMEQSPVYLYDPVTDFVHSELRRRAVEYTTCESIHIWCGTFNLNGRSMGMHQDLSSWLCPPMIQSAGNPDILVVGFQEIVELSPQQIMSTDPERLRGWERSVVSSLNATRNGDYVLLRSGQLVGAALLVLVKKGVLNRIKNVEGAERKLGMSGIAGNKGAVAIRFDYGNTRLCFVTAHLAAGFANIEERNRDYNTISRGLRFQHNRSIEDHDGIIWAGDFNYRIGLGDEKVRQLIKLGDLDQLYHNDQLSLQMIAGKIFPYYSEARITFMPTYKYENGTDEYDQSEKARIPAWCDRILRKGEILKQLGYSTAPLMFSDHRPVYATFQCSISLIDEASKQKLNESLHRKRLEDVGDFIADDQDDFQDEDLVGYEPIAPELPAASSDRRKWWLDDQLPARSSIERPYKHAILSDSRPSNPFTPNQHSPWRDSFVTPESSPAAGGGIHGPQHTAKDIESPWDYHESGNGDLQSHKGTNPPTYTRGYQQGNNESNTQQASPSSTFDPSTTRKPPVPRKRFTAHTNARSTEEPSRLHVIPLNLVDTNDEAESEAISLPVLEPTRRNGP